MVLRAKTGNKEHSKITDKTDKTGRKIYKRVNRRKRKGAFIKKITKSPNNECCAVQKPKG